MNFEPWGLGIEKRKFQRIIDQNKNELTWEKPILKLIVSCLNLLIEGRELENMSEEELKEELESLESFGKIINSPIPYDKEKGFASPKIKIKVDASEIKERFDKIPSSYKRSSIIDSKTKKIMLSTVGENKQEFPAIVLDLDLNEFLHKGDTIAIPFDHLRFKKKEFGPSFLRFEEFKSFFLSGETSMIVEITKATRTPFKDYQDQECKGRIINFYTD